MKSKEFDNRLKILLNTKKMNTKQTLSTEPLTENDLVIGGKYIPISKTALYKDSLEESIALKKAKRIGQKFLYYTGRDDHFYTFNHKPSDEPAGDYFNPSDVIPYIEENKTNAEHTVKEGEDLKEGDSFEYFAYGKMREGVVTAIKDGFVHSKDFPGILVENCKKINPKATEPAQGVNFTGGEDLLDKLTKDDLIKVIGYMHDTIQAWDNGWGLPESEAQTLIKIGSACTKKCADERDFNLSFTI